jgi:hypothetical protein
MRVKVAITGTLSQPRREIVRLIEGRTNAEFSPEVTYDTNYLVASRFDTDKARRAAKLGVTVISESEMSECISRGLFPENDKPTRPRTYPPNFRTEEIVWHEEFEPQRLCFLEYSDNEGVRTQRFITLARKGVGSNGHEYLGAFDGDTFKTFRSDRVTKLEVL